MALELQLLLKDKAISATARLEFERRAPSGRTLVLDACGFDLKDVRLSTRTADGTSALNSLDAYQYSYDSEQIVIPLAAEVSGGSVEIEYRAVPRLGLYFLGPDEDVPDRPTQVWSQCQDEDGKHWFPCQDKPHVKMTYELKATVPAGMTVLSGGQLVQKDTKTRKLHTFHYRLDEPTPAYLVTLVVGTFDEWTESVQLPSGRQVELRFLVPPGRVQDGKRAFARTAEAMRLFSERTGVEYPFESYSQVVVADFIFGGMENTTATTMYEHILIDKTAELDIDSHDLVAHELAHHWFGDLVTCRDWSHGWLNEGFATYFEHLEREHRLGLDEYEHSVTADLLVYLGEADGAYTRAIVCRDYDEPIDLFDRHLYQKGGLVLHMLRKELGEDCFWRGIKTYLLEKQGGIVETNDLMRKFEEISGLSLERFFDQWVYRPGHPHLKINVRYEDGLLMVDVEQTQKGDDVAVFHLPFEILVCEEGKQTLHRRDMDERHSSLVVATKNRPQWISVDPDYRLCAPIHLTAPADMLRNLLESGPRARARRMAALALGRRQDPKTVQALIRCLQSEDELWMVRAKAASSLAKILGQEAEQALLAAASIEHPKVRRAVAEALGAVPSKEAASALIKLTKDPSYLVSAAAARALGKNRDERNVAVLKGLLRKNSWSEVIRSGALAALARWDEDQVAETIIDWTRYGRPLRARRAALAALPEVGESKKILKHLQDMLRDRDPHIRMAVLDALSTLGDAKAKPAIEELLLRELDGGVKTRARAVLSVLGKDGKAGLKEAREDTQKLRREVSELKTRLSKLEQVSKGDKAASGQDKGKAGTSRRRDKPGKTTKAVANKRSAKAGAHTITPNKKKSPKKKPSPRG